MSTWISNNHVNAVVTYADQSTRTFPCWTLEGAVWRWMREMTAEENKGNPARSCQWFLSRSETGGGVLIGEFRMPPAEPDVTARAHGGDTAVFASGDAEAGPALGDAEAE